LPWLVAAGFLIAAAILLLALALQTIAPHAAPSASPSPHPVVSVIGEFCPGGHIGPEHDYNRDEPAIYLNDFGPPLMTTPDIQADRPSASALSKALRHRLCTFKEQAKVTVAAAFPNWPGLRGPFNWAAGLKLLARGDWAHARNVWHNPPPPGDTFGMWNEPNGPITFTTTPIQGGWYLEVPFQGGSQSYRDGCGGQPSLASATIEALHGLFPAR
jgi:hypothetical protein